MQPTVILSLAATLPPAPNAEEETIYGKLTAPTAAPVVFLRKLRRVISLLICIMHLLPFELPFYLFVCQSTKTKQSEIVIKSAPFVKLKSHSGGFGTAIYR